MIHDICLRADTEAVLAAALPWLRADGAWLTDGADHALCPLGPVAVTDAVLDDAGEVLVPAVIDGRWHANLRLRDTHPDAAAILAACQPYCVAPARPRVVWA